MKSQIQTTNQEIAREDSKLLSLVASQTENLVIITNKEGKVEWVNDYFTKITEYTLQDMLGKKPGDVLQGKDTNPEDIAAIGAKIRKKEPFTHEIYNYSKSGTGYWLEISISPILDEHGEPKQFIAIEKDITSRKKAEELLLRREAQYRQLVENSNDIIYTLSPDGTFTFVSQAWERLLGHETKEIVGTSFSEFVHPDDLEKCFAFLNTVLETGERMNHIEYRVRDKENKWKWHTSSASPKTDGSGDIIGFDGLARDITAKKKAKQQIKAAVQKAARNERKYHNLINNVEIGIVEHHADTSIISCNARSRELLGLTEEQMRGKVAIDPYWKFIYQDGSTIPVEDYPVMRVIQHGEAQKNQVLGVLQPEKEVTWLLVNGFPSFTDDNQVETITISFIDITDRIAAEAAMIKAKEKAERNENRLKIASQSAQLGIYDWDIVSNNLIWDDRMYEIYGSSAKEATTIPELWDNRMHPEDKERVNRDVQYALEGTKDFDTTFRLCLPDDEIIHIRANGMILRDDEGNPLRMIGSNRDITFPVLRAEELREARDKAEKREFELRESQKIAKVGSWYLNTLTDEVYWSKELYKMYDFDPDLPVPPYTEHMKLFTPESWDLLSTELEKTRLEGIPYELELETVRKDQGNGWMWVRGEAVFGKNMQIIGLRGVAQDISDKKRSFLQLERLSLVASNVQQSVIITDADKKVTWVNEAFFDLTGYNYEEVEGETLGQFLQGAETDARDIETLNRLIEAQEPFTHKILNYRKDGSSFWNELSITPLFDSNEELEGYIALQKDITEKVEYETAILQQKERISNIANSVPGALLLYERTPEGVDNCLLISDQVEEIFEISSSEAMDNISLLWGCFFEEDVPIVAKAVADSAETMTLYTSVGRIRTKSGKVKYVKGTGFPKRQPNGNIWWDTLIMDVTEWKTSEAALQRIIGEKNNLFKELHHRIKNNLHMVSSLMYSKSRLSDNESVLEFISETRNRINTIAKVHDKLLHLEEMNELYSKSYLEDLVFDVIKSLALDPSLYPIESTIEDHKMNVDTILALGLILNESISNIIKHAYDPDDGGTIKISFKSEHGNYKLLIQDKGVGMQITKDDRRLKSVGLMMIEQLSKQLNGEIRREVDGGTLFELVFPIPE